MVPMGFRPVQKLMGDDRGPIEEYEYQRLYGTSTAFWDKPWRDWFRPAMYSTANMMGLTSKPLWRQDADANQEYFDKLEFTKWMQLAQEAEKRGDGRTKMKYMYLASNTRTGVNPQGNPLSIYWTLPREERAFFNAFANAPNSERDRILQMVPGDQVHLYQAIWNRMDQGDPGLWAGSPTAVDTEYLNKQFYELDDYFSYQPKPREDWVGYHSDVDIGDIRVKYIDELGKDLHDYGLWSKQLKKAQAQEEILGNSTGYLHASGGISRGGLFSNLRRLLPGHVTVHSNQGLSSSAHINYNDDRLLEIQSKYRDYTNGY